jgi:hypothetical protein
MQTRFAMESVSSEYELQAELERFTARFTDRITQATAALDSSEHPEIRPEIRDEALRKNLLYVSSAMEIATGLSSQINLLDMVVFVRLCRTVLDRHWIPTLYGRHGGELADAFASSEDQILAIAARALQPGQSAQLARVIDTWLADNPDQTRVEGVRLADFAAAAGAAASERTGQATGLLSSVKAARQTANQAALLSERGLFLFHRMPSLWRLQARLGAREMLSDALVQLCEGPDSPVARLTGRARRLARRGLLCVGLLGAGALVWLLVRHG